MDEHPFTALKPAVLLDAVESVGLEPDGHLLPLNSYENRVYQFGIEDAPTVVAKFYRPGRWPDEAIREEHRFAERLVDAEVPMVPPLTIGGDSLHWHQGYRFAVYPQRGGRPPELDDPNHLQWLGRVLGRLHTVGAIEPFQQRPAIEAPTIDQVTGSLLADGWIPDYLRDAYTSVTDDVAVLVRAAFERAGAVPRIRLHGDCHPGNILWTEAGPHFVDLDDALQGPAIQDLWMLLAGDRDEMLGQLADLLAGYEDFCAFDRRELHLVEALRTLRLVRFSGWLARRWDDPAFPRAFPWFAEARYWEEHLLALREQAAALQEEPLVA